MRAVSRPKYGPNKVLCDGKLGIWPFVMDVPAKRNSKNRVASTLETKCIESITKKDNARPHITNRDEDFRKVASADGWNIKFTHQPPNSPDLNVLDLGFFRAIQSLQEKKKSNVLDELVHNTMKAFEELDVVKLNYVFITLQACMLEIMPLKGGIDYPIPHMHKTKLAAQGLLPNI
ncbi:uncharacterized protein LOC141620727 [Silene latifolia]|uniref:uncharacterized protein LOC141620727 n=1 Tax=Silene latifolia TaxID=37657 RepID=UPI003D76FF85